MWDISIWKKDLLYIESVIDGLDNFTLTDATDDDKLFRV